MITLSIDQAASRFTHIISLIGKGEEVIVLDHNQPVARITRYQSLEVDRPKVGTITSAPVRYVEDCFAPLTDADLKDWGL